MSNNTPYWVSHVIAKKGLAFALGQTCSGLWSWSLVVKGDELTTLVFSEEYTTKAGAQRGLTRFRKAIGYARTIEE